MKRLFVLAVAVLGVGSLARADTTIWCGLTPHRGEMKLWKERSWHFANGNTLYDWCMNSDSQGSCAGYIEGIADAATAQNIYNICVPTGTDVTGEEIVDVVKKYLTDHPETRHYIAFSVILSALLQAYPCGKS